MNPTRKKAMIAVAASAVVLFASALPALAQPVDLGLGYGADIGLPSMDIRNMVASVIRSLMGLLGIILVMQIMWGGFLMMTHEGNEDRKAEAVATLKNSIIGLLIIMSSASIVRFVVDALANATQTYL